MSKTNKRDENPLGSQKQAEALRELAVDPATEPQETWNQGVDVLEDQEQEQTKPKKAKEQ